LALGVHSCNTIAEDISIEWYTMLKLEEVFNVDEEETKK
jgi:hypothetical protein